MDGAELNSSKRSDESLRIKTKLPEKGVTVQRGKRKEMELTLKKWSNLEEVISEHTCLIGGTIGSGKSVLMDSILFNISAQGLCDAAAGIIDLKRVQYNKWLGLPHLQELGIAEDITSATAMIDRVTGIMEARYSEIKASGAVKYTGKRIYLLIDETAVLLEHRGIEQKLSHLLRLCRAANICVIMATQSPQRSKGGGITASIQNNITSAIGLRCRSSIESRQIVGVSGCESLPRYGKGLFWNSEGLCYLEIPMTPDEMIAERVQVWKEAVVADIKQSKKPSFGIFKRKERKLA